MPAAFQPADLTGRSKSWLIAAAVRSQFTQLARQRVAPPSTKFPRPLGESHGWFPCIASPPGECGSHTRH